MDPETIAIKEPDVKSEEVEDSSPAIEQSQSEQVKEQPKVNTPPNHRFKQIIDEKNELKRKLEELEARQTASPSETPKDKTPDVSEFDSDEAYQNALIDFKVNQRIQKALEAQESERKSKIQRDNAAKATISFESKLQQYVAKNPGFDQDQQRVPNLRLSPTVSQAIVSLEGSDRDGNPLGAKLYHYFYQNPEKAEELGSFDPVRAAVEIGKLSSALASGGSKKTTNAPPPMRSSNGAPAITMDFSKLDDDSFEKAYREACYGKR